MQAPREEPISAEMPRPLAGSFTFIADDGSEQSWSPADHAGAIRALAGRLAAHVPRDAAIGLLFRSGADLVASWFACITAGLRPLVMQYPTRKQSHAYWSDSVTDTIDRTGIAAILADPYCASLSLPGGVALLRHDALPAAPSLDAPILPAQFSILQLSSGTTGHRKAMAFSSNALRRHAEDYNQVLRLRPGQDRIVSWLPLYHDMGYVACFVMPILLGIDVVMMDPVSWVARPELLFDAIARHRGTVCYMPNFGFEVMTRAPAPPMPSMRHWISCSEPVSATTAAKFVRHIDADPASFAPCYAMAENVFAVTFGQALNTRMIDGAEVVSCGRPIPGVQVKIVDGEIVVRSETSITHYLDGQPISDAEGYYPTGDLGQLCDGGLYVVGRKQDMLIQAGRKFMLSDIDLRLNEAFPAIRGRGATLALHDDRLGTERPLILIEAVDFFDRTDRAEIVRRMTDVLGVDQLDVAFVPPRFLTKTSSGKINRRKTRDDWIAVQRDRTRGAPPRDLARQLHDEFAHVDWSQPMRAVLDSLSMTIIRIMLESTDVAFDPAWSLRELATTLTTRAPTTSTNTTKGIRIVSLADRQLLSRLTEGDLARLGERLGCPVSIEHICLPPSFVLLSDLIFHDWFQARLPQDVFGDVDQALQRVKQASVILVDTIAELKFLYASTYPALNHALEREPAADLICLRWPGYTRQHHRLPLSSVAGMDIPLDTCNETIGQLSRYLGTPIFRIASMPGFEAQCAAWEHVCKPNTKNRRAEATQLLETLASWIEHTNVRRTALPAERLQMSDLAHFCAIAARQETVDRVIAQYDSFYIAGQAASLPYLRRRLDDIGKPYVLAPSFAPEIMERLPERHDCVIACGSFGARPADVPFIAFQHVGETQRTHNLGAFADELAALGRVNAMKRSGTGWYHSFALRRSQEDVKTWRAARAAVRRTVAIGVEEDL